MSLNKVFLHGNLTKDPELKRTAKGAACCWLNVAVNSVSDNGENKAKYFYVQTWGSLAENCSKYLKKGSSVLVEGKLDYYIEEKNGYKNTKHYVSSDKVRFLNSGGKPQQQSEPKQGTIPF